MAAAESFAKEHGVRWLRISVMSENTGARKLYASSGFNEIYLELEKDLGSP
jgi:ribosomal protein S18 acetylase RimI-like enzyme